MIFPLFLDEKDISASSTPHDVVPSSDSLSDLPTVSREMSLEEVHSLEEEYRTIGENLTDDLEQKSVSIRDLQIYAANIPHYVRRDFEEPGKNQMLDKTTRATDVFHFVGALNECSNFLNPTLLADAVEKFGNEELKLKMRKFKEKSENFQKSTTLEQFVKKCSSWTGKYPEGYKEIEMELKADWKEKTFKDIAPPKKTWLLFKVYYGSLRVVVAIPDLTHLQEEVVLEFLQLHVKKVFINGECFLNFESGIPKVTKTSSPTVSLRDLLNDPKVLNCESEWKDVGLELEVPNWKLAEVAKNNPHDVSKCKREMLIYFLDNYYENPTLAVVHEAIKTVEERREREKNRHDLDQEKIEVVGAFNQLREFLDAFDSRNQMIESEMKEHIAGMRKEKEWIDETKSQELEGEKETKRKIHSALHGDDLHRSSFSNNFLSTKYGIEAHKMRAEEVEGYLRKALIEIEIKESQAIQDRYKDAKSHFDQQTHLKKELDALKKNLDDHLEAYAVIKKDLIKLGVEEDALNINCLEKRIQCTILVDECNEVHSYGKQKVEDYSRELQGLIDSFNSNTEELRKIGQSIVELIKIKRIVTLGRITTGVPARTFRLPTVHVGTAIISSLFGRTVANWLTTENKERERERLSRSKKVFCEDLQKAYYELEKLKNTPLCN